jgi:hypothetical protein
LQARRRRNTSKKLSLQKKLSFAKQTKINAIATLLEEILEGNFFHFGNKEAKQQQQRIDLN